MYSLLICGGQGPVIITSGDNSPIYPHN